VVKEGQGLGRLDTWLAAEVNALSRRQAQALISRGDVTVDGQACKKGQRLQPGSQVAIWSQVHPQDWAPKPDTQVKLTILFKDDDIIALDKPSGIPSQPLQPDELGTVANAVVARFPECGRIGRSSGDGGLVHRLDVETSGVMLAARSRSVHQILLDQQQHGNIEKVYLAMVHASTQRLPLRIDTPLLPAGKGGYKVKPAPKGAPATTWIRMVRAHNDAMLVEARIAKGFRHQIRAHLASAGFPIVGDSVYGSAALEVDSERLLLHASELHLRHPTQATPLTLSSPLPSAFLSVMEQK